MSAIFKYLVFGLVVLCFNNFLQSGKTIYSHGSRLVSRFFSLIVKGQIGGIPNFGGGDPRFGGVGPQNGINPGFNPAVQQSGFNPGAQQGVVQPGFNMGGSQFGANPALGAGGFNNIVSRSVRNLPSSRFSNSNQAGHQTHHNPNFQHNSGHNLQHDKTSNQDFHHGKTFNQDKNFHQNKDFHHQNKDFHHQNKDFHHQNKDVFHRQPVNRKCFFCRITFRKKWICLRLDGPHRF